MHVIGDVDVTGSIDGDAGRPAELAIASTAAAVGRQVLPVPRKRLDAVVAPVRHVHSAVSAHDRPQGMLSSAGPVPSRPKDARKQPSVVNFCTRRL